jgi:hypothetical protein
MAHSLDVAALLGIFPNSGPIPESVVWGYPFFGTHTGIMGKKIEVKMIFFRCMILNPPP